ncbi:hypothetical protein D3C76_1143720 [compost metagenome]
MGRQHTAQGTGRQSDEDQLTVLQGRQQVIDRINARVNFHPFEVTRVFPVAAHGLGLFGVAHPLPYADAVFRQQIRHGGAETPASKHCNRLLFSHIRSVKTN